MFPAEFASLTLIFMNQLYYGDNLDILRKHIRDEAVDLCYIDPPFNSKRNYNQIYNNAGKEDLAQATLFRCSCYKTDSLVNVAWATIGNLSIAARANQGFGHFDDFCLYQRC